MESSKQSSSSSLMPVGCKFIPTDRELLFYYLWHKVNNKSTPYNIKEIDIYTFHPQQLFDMYARKTGYDDQKSQDTDNYLYFYTKIKKLSENGSRASITVAVRSSSEQPCQETVIGTWKGQATGKCLKMVGSKGVVVRGLNKAFTYQSNYNSSSRSKKRNKSAPCEDRVECSFTMHEYSLVGFDSHGYILCKIRRMYDKNKIMLSNKKNDIEMRAESSSQAATATRWKDGETSNRTRPVNRFAHHQEQVVSRTSQRNFAMCNFVTVTPAPVPLTDGPSSSTGRTWDANMKATESSFDNLYYHQDVVAMNSNCTSGNITTAPHYHDVTELNNSCASDNTVTTAPPPDPFSTSYDPFSNSYDPFSTSYGLWEEMRELQELLQLDEKTDGLLSTEQRTSAEELTNSYISNPYHHQDPANAMNGDWQQRLIDSILTEASATAAASTSGRLSSVEGKAQNKQTGGLSLAAETTEEETGRISSMPPIISEGRSITEPYNDSPYGRLNEADNDKFMRK